MEKTKSHKMVQIIGVFRLIKGVLLIGIATGGIALLGSDINEKLSSLLHHIHSDPGNRYIQKFLTKIVGLSPRLPLILIGSFVYGTVFLIEGTGLLMQKRWAEYLTVIVTGSFLPLEIYELIKKFSAIKTTVLILNAAIVVYLIIRLRHDRTKEKKRD